jgi:translation initiation factor 3 subunit I
MVVPAGAILLYLELTVPPRRSSILYLQRPRCVRLVFRFVTIQFDIRSSVADRPGIVNGERLGTYNGHQGALWTVDVDPTTTLLATGAADNTIKLWEVRTGRCIKTWDFPTAVKRVEFSEDGTLLLAVTEMRMGHLGTLVVFPIVMDSVEEQADEPLYTITFRESKATVAAWGYLNKFLITGHEDGSVSQYDAKTGELIQASPAHEVGMQITDIQMASDRTYFVTASKDKSAKLIETNTLRVLKTYQTDTPLNSAAITAKKDFIILGGGQEARDVTTTSQRQGKFEARFYHKIFEDEIGRVRGHFGPLNTVRTLTAGIFQEFRTIVNTDTGTIRLLVTP